MRVRFTERYQYETGGRHEGPTFEAGQVEEFRRDIAERFIRRGVAVAADDDAAPAETATAEPKAEAPVAEAKLSTPAPAPAPEPRRTRR